MIHQRKSIYAYLYFCPDATACGCYLLSVDRSAADLSITAASLDDDLDEFMRRGLILRDKLTGEIFVADWPRWHNFNSPQARGALWASISKIQSRSLWMKVKKAYESIPEPGKGKEKGKVKASSKEEESNDFAAQRLRLKPSRSPQRVKCWTPEDHQEAQVLENKYGPRVQEAVRTLEQDGIEALPSRVARALHPPSVNLPAMWWETESGTKAAAEILGIHPNPGERWPELRQRIREQTLRMEIHE